MAFRSHGCCCARKILLFPPRLLRIQSSTFLDCHSHKPMLLARNHGEISGPNGSFGALVRDCN